MKNLILENEKFWFAIFTVFVTLILMVFNYFGFL